MKKLRLSTGLIVYLLSTAVVDAAPIVGTHDHDVPQVVEAVKIASRGTHFFGTTDDSMGALEARRENGLKEPALSQLFVSRGGESIEGSQRPSRFESSGSTIAPQVEVRPGARPTQPTSHVLQTGHRQTHSSNSRQTSACEGKKVESVPSQGDEQGCNSIPSAGAGLKRFVPYSDGFKRSSLPGSGTSTPNPLTSNNVPLSRLLFDNSFPWNDVGASTRSGSPASICSETSPHNSQTCDSNHHHPGQGWVWLPLKSKLRRPQDPESHEPNSPTSGSFVHTSAASSSGGPPSPMSWSYQHGLPYPES